MITTTDIDIDVANRDRILRLLRNTPAMIEGVKKNKKHNTGVYFHKIPDDPITGLATIDYKQAEDMGYFKLDILNVSLYEKINSQAQLDYLMQQETDWAMLEDPNIVKKCFHIHRHFNIVNKLKPDSLPKLAAVLGLIRPAKKHLVQSDWNTILNEVWIKPEDSTEGYFFKKAHAYAYAQAIMLQLNMIKEGIL